MCHLYSFLSHLRPVSSTCLAFTTTTTLPASSCGVYVGWSFPCTHGTRNRPSPLNSSMHIMTTRQCACAMTSCTLKQRCQQHVGHGTATGLHCIQGYHMYSRVRRLLITAVESALAAAEPAARRGGRQLVPWRPQAGNSALQYLRSAPKSTFLAMPFTPIASRLIVIDKAAAPGGTLLFASSAGCMKAHQAQ